MKPELTPCDEAVLPFDEAQLGVGVLQGKVRTTRANSIPRRTMIAYLQILATIYDPF